ncbi:MAG: T9SS type A sorting domain-containing protein [bacterium]
MSYKNYYLLKNGFILIFTLLFCIVNNSMAIPAFTGAEGFGANTPGGRGGRIIHVTNLNPLGPGSFKAAMEASGPRIVVFDVSGIIDLNYQTVRATSGDLTVAGQTSPGGITLIKVQIYIGKGDVAPSSYASDVIIRHIRLRGAPYEGDCMSIYGAKRVVLDHVSAAWGCDETISITHAEDVTMQWCFIEESCNLCHGESGHNDGTLISYNKEGTKFSLHHNLWTHHSTRVPWINQGSVDMRNCVMYDSDNRGVRFYGTDYKIIGNYINNYYIMGPTFEKYREDFLKRGGWSQYSSLLLANSEVYISGNILKGITSLNQTEMSKYQCTYSGGICVMDDESQLNANCVEKGMCRTGGPMLNTDTAHVTTYSADSSYNLVLEKGGAFPRDTISLRMVVQVQNETGGFVDCEGSKSGVNFPQDDLSLPLFEKPQDTDNDGMPDAWEDSLGLAKNDSSDCGGDRDDDGYTNIEEYINWLADELIGGNPPFRPMDIKYGAKSKRALNKLSAHPNPFSNSIVIPLPGNSRKVNKLSVEIFDVMGKLVWSKRFSAYSTQACVWNGRDLSGRTLPNGIYLLKMQDQDTQNTLKNSRLFLN